MQDETEQGPACVFRGLNADGLICVQMPNADSSHASEI